MAASKSSTSNTTIADDPLVGVDLDDGEHLGEERFGPLVTAREAGTTSRARRSPRVAMTSMSRSSIRQSAIARTFAISASRPCGIPVLTTRRRSSTGKVVGQHLRHGVPVAGGEVRQEALIHLACRVFQPRCRPAELFESRDRGVQVCLVEYFAAVDHVAFDRENRDPAPLGVETLLRGLIRRVSDDRSEVGQPMHGLDIDVEVLVPSPARRGCMRSGHRAPSLSPVGGRC